MVDSIIITEIKETAFNFVPWLPRRKFRTLYIATGARSYATENKRKNIF